MAKVEHIIGGKKYLYEHQRVNGKVKCTYLGKMDDDESISLRERIAQLEDVLRSSRTLREARRKAGVV